MVRTCTVAAPASQLHTGRLVAPAGSLCAGFAGAAAAGGADGAEPGLTQLRSPVATLNQYGCWYVGSIASCQPDGSSSGSGGAAAAASVACASGSRCAGVPSPFATTPRLLSFASSAGGSCFAAAGAPSLAAVPAPEPAAAAPATPPAGPAGGLLSCGGADSSLMTFGRGTGGRAWGGAVMGLGARPEGTAALACGGRTGGRTAGGAAWCGCVGTAAGVAGAGAEVRGGAGGGRSTPPVDIDGKGVAASACGGAACPPPALRACPAVLGAPEARSRPGFTPAAPPLGVGADGRGRGGGGGGRSPFCAKATPICWPGGVLRVAPPLLAPFVTADVGGGALGSLMSSGTLQSALHSEVAFTMQRATLTTIPLRDEQHT